jgi:hypothetical protein
VIESPVCTPIGSKFSIEQTMMTLSFLSRTTSSSYSFQPAIDSSTRISLFSDSCRPRAADVLELLQVVGDAAAAAAHREARADHARQADHVERLARLVHRVGELRTGARQADLLHRVAELEAALGLLDRLRARADHLDAELLSTPMSCSCIAQLRAVWPPSVGRIASGRSCSMILATTSA